MARQNSDSSGGRNSEERRARAAQLREERLREERKRKRNTILVAVVAALVAAGLIAVAVVTQHKATTGAAAEIIPSKLSGSPTAQKAVKPVPDTSGIDGVLAWDTGNYPGAKESPTQMEHDHVEGPVTFTVVPPVGGPHSATWMNAGVYTKPIPSERAIHNLEHGGVWITYRPNVAKSDVTALRALVAKQSLIPENAQANGIPGDANRFVDLSPWVDNTLPSPVVISAWGHQLRVDSASDPRLQKFIDTFRNSKTYTPEYGGAVDGVPTTTGGQPAYSGSTKANPKGSQS